MVAKRAINEGKVMASLYKKNNIWYVSTYVNGKRISKSLKTKQRKTAYKLLLKIIYFKNYSTKYYNNLQKVSQQCVSAFYKQKSPTLGEAFS